MSYNEKEIEEMAKVSCRNHIECCDCKSASGENNYKVSCLHIRAARHYVDAGYGNVKQAVKEFAKKLKEQFKNYCILSVKQSCGIIDNLITESYGADDDV